MNITPPGPKALAQAWEHDNLPALVRVRRRLDDGPSSHARTQLSRRLDQWLRRESRPHGPQPLTPAAAEWDRQVRVHRAADVASLSALIQVGATDQQVPADLRRDADILLTISSLRLQELQELPPPPTASTGAATASIWQALGAALLAPSRGLDVLARNWLARGHQAYGVLDRAERELLACSPARSQAVRLECLAALAALYRALGTPQQDHLGPSVLAGDRRARWIQLLPLVRTLIRVRRQALNDEALETALVNLVRYGAPATAPEPSWLHLVADLWTTERYLAGADTKERPRAAIQRQACLQALLEALKPVHEHPAMMACGAIRALLEGPQLAQHADA